MIDANWSKNFIIDLETDRNFSFWSRFRSTVMILRLVSGSWSENIAMMTTLCRPNHFLVGSIWSLKKLHSYKMKFDPSLAQKSEGCLIYKYLIRILNGVQVLLRAFLYFYLFNTAESKQVFYKKCQWLYMNGRPLCVESNHSANWTTTTTQGGLSFRLIDWFAYV